MLDLRVGFALVVENFSKCGVVKLRLDFSCELENGCMDVPFVHSNSMGCLQIEKWEVVVLAAVASFHAIFYRIGG